jgi:hypothetical protein
MVGVGFVSWQPSTCVKRYRSRRPRKRSGVDMEVPVNTFQYMFNFAAKSNFNLKCSLPVPPNGIAARSHLPGTQPSGMILLDKDMKA